MKKLFLVIAAMAVLLFAAAIAKDALIRVSVERGVELVTGLKLRMADFKASLLKTTVNIKSLELFNPNGFKDRRMLIMPEIYINYDLPSIIKGKTHLPEVRIALDEFIVVKNEEGRLNLDSLKAVQAHKTRTRPSGRAPQIQIDSLELKIGKVIYKDYSRRQGEAVVKEFNLNLNERYANIDDPHALVSLIVVKALTNTTVANLTNFDLHGLRGTISDTLGRAERIATRAVSVAGSTAAKTREVAEETARTAGEAAKRTVGAIKSLLSPFSGSDEPSESWQ